MADELKPNEVNERLKQWQESGHEALAAQVTPETLNTDTRTVDCVWFTSIDVPRIDWMTGAISAAV